MRLANRVAALLSALFIFSAINDNPHDVVLAVITAAVLLAILWVRRWIKSVKRRRR